jgi:hypothetical protein
MGPDVSGFFQQLVTPVPDQVRDDGPGVHVDRLKMAGDIRFFPVTLPPSRSDEHGFPRIEYGAGSSQARNDGPGVHVRAPKPSPRAKTRGPCWSAEGGRRHFAPSGNSSAVSSRWTWIPAFAGMTEKGRTADRGRLCRCAPRNDNGCFWLFYDLIKACSRDKESPS